MSDILAVPLHDIDPIDLTLAKTIADTLEYHYPGWAWQVNINSDGGIINVLSGVLNDRITRNYGYVLHISDMHNYNAICKKVVMVGGEMLERANMPRRRWEGQEPTSMELH